MSDFPDAAFRFFAALPRQGPGSAQETRAVVERLPPLPRQARVIDVGCGTGASSLVLAEALAENLAPPITAYDLAPLFLETLAARAEKAGLAERVVPVEADMAALPVAAESVDLLWSESSVYNLGLGPGLRAWRALLKPGGLAVVSDAAWRVADPTPEAKAFWQAGYPGMHEADEAVATAQAEGYRVLFTHWLDRSGWEAYFGPMEAALAAGGHGLPEEMVEGLRGEIALWRAHGDDFGYLFLALQKA